MRINTICPGYISSLGGPSYVCNSLLEAICAAGYEVSLYCVSGDNSAHRPYHRYSMPLWAKPLGYKLVSEELWEKYTEWRYLRSFRATDIAYIWNFTSIETYRALKSAGRIIIAENVNTHQATSKEILDEEYRRLGMASGHGIDERAIAKESAKLELVDYVFSPSPEVTKSLLRADVAEEKIIRSSYGLSPQNVIPRSDIAGRASRADLTAVFVGRIGIRKGVHLLLDYWAKARVSGKLLLVGNIEPSAKRLVEPYLGKHGIEHVPFTHDLRTVYINADILLLPSLEEGSPLVAYLAMGAGLPSIVSPMGGGGVIDDGKEGLVIGPHQADGWIDAIRMLFSDAGLRQRLSGNAYDKAGEYLWGKVGRRRMESLAAALAARTDGGRT